MDEPAAATQPADRNAERRGVPRFEVEEDARLLLVSQSADLPCRVLDLSLGGCRVLTRDRIVAGPHQRVEISFRVRGFAFRLCGVTQWMDRRNQVGIRFLEMSERRRIDLAEVLGEVEEIARIKAEKEAAARAAEETILAEKLARELNETLDAIARQAQAEGTVETASLEEHLPELDPAIPEQAEPPAGEPRPPGLKMVWPAAEPGSRPIQGPLILRPPQAAPLPKPLPAVEKKPPQSPAPAAPAAPRPSPRDRRAQSRQSVDTRAVIFLVRIGSGLGGRILDLSVGGCRIRTDERFPVGIYTRVETEFRLEGLPFRLGGVVQAIHDKQTVGIRFLDISPRKLEQVEQLMEEIRELRERQGPGAAPGGETGPTMGAGSPRQAGGAP